jgi:hypothetical protein
VAQRPPNDKTFPEMLAELKAMVPENEAILRSFTPAERQQEEGAIAAGKLASTTERVAMKLESFDAVIEMMQAGAASFRTLAEQFDDPTHRAVIEDLARSCEDLYRELTGHEPGSPGSPGR